MRSVPAHARLMRLLATRVLLAGATITIVSFLACSGESPSGPPVPTLDLTRSTLTIATGPYIAGEQYVATLTARNSSGAAFIEPLTVVFDLVGGTTDGTFSAVSGSGGSYTANFTATVAGSPSQLTATVNGTPMPTTGLPSVTVIPGPASLTASTLVSAASVLTVGESSAITLTVRDALQNIRTGGSDVVVFGLGAGASQGTLSATVNNGDGTYSSTFTATSAGTARTVTATIGGVAVSSTLPSITVNPAPASLSQSLVTVVPPTIVSGGTTVLTLTVRDAGGTPLTSGGATVTFTKGAGTSDGTIGATTDNGNGTYTAPFAGTTAGTARAIGATIDGAAVTSVAPTITVQPGPASLAQSTVSVASGQLTTGATTTVTLSTRDAAENALTSGGLTVVFTKGGGTSDGSLSAVTDNGDGSYTATFTATTAGTARTIGATIDGQSVVSALPSITVTAAAVSLAQSTVTVGQGTIESGSATTLTLTARDAGGVPFTSGGLTVVFTKGSGTSDGTISATTDNGNGTYSAAFTGTTAGTARSMSATIGGDVLTSVAPTITVLPGAASVAQSSVTVASAQLVAGTSTAVTLTARDAAGNALTSGGLAVAFTKGSGTSDGTFSTTTDNGNGTYTASFTGTIAGTARTLSATLGGVALTSAAPTVTVTPGAASALSTLSVSAAAASIGGVVTLTLTARDLADNLVGAGGATVLFTKGTGTSDGTISPTTDVGNGTYTATFTATTSGTARTIGATVNGAEITTTLPSITVSAPPLMALGTDTAYINVQAGTLSSTQLVTVANIGSGSIAGLSATSINLPGGEAQCASVDWIGMPTFDQGGVAAPLSLMSLRADAAGLAAGTCRRAVTVTSTTPGVASRQLVVVAKIGKTPVAEGAVTVVMMGNAGSNTLQTILPTPLLSIDNGGRGTISGVTATVISTTGYAECVDPDNEDTCAPWLTNADLQLSSTTLPATLSIVSQVRPYSASAVVRVQGTGMAARDFNINVLFNIEPELVTNARNVMLRGFAGGGVVADTVIALNQNAANGSLTDYRLDPAGPALPSWMSVDITPLSGARAQVIVSADLSGFTQDTSIVSPTGFRLAADFCIDPEDCEFSGTATKRFTLAYALLVDGGLSISEANPALFAPVGTTASVRDLTLTNLGAGELSDLGAVVEAGVPWLTAQFVGGTTTPATLRLTADPAGRTAGTYTTTVTVSRGAGATLQSRTIPVRMIVY